MAIDEEEVPRHEHVQWCKDRALKFFDRDDLGGAMSSFLSDMNKHPLAREQLDVFLLGIGQQYLVSNNAQSLKHWIEGF